MSCDNVGVFEVLLVQRFELPIGSFGELCVLEVGDFAEDGDFFNQVLQSASM
jgi:hypothetical protein